MKINERYSDISELEIKMIDEDILVEVHDQEYVELFYESNRLNKIEISKHENRLIVERVKILEQLISLPMHKGILKLYVPKNKIRMESLNSISGKIDSELSCDAAELVTISGKIIDKGSHEKLLVKSTSGSINIYRPSKVLQFKSISGSVKLVSASDSVIKGTTISGSVILDISPNDNYRIKYKSISGHFKDPHANQRSSINESRILANFDIQTTSGNCKIDSWYK